MKTKNYFCIALLVAGILSQPTIAQSPNWQWSKTVGDNGADIAYAVATDGNGNVYSTGFFVNTVDFDPGAGVNNLTSDGGSYDVFLLKLDGSGNFLWVKQFSGSSNEVGNAITTDANGNVYLTGWFSGTTDFDPGSGIVNLNAAGGGNDIFVAKLDSSGDLIWAKSMTGFGLNGDDEGRGIAVDTSGNVYSTGNFHGKVDFDPGNAIYYLNSSGSFTKDVFVSKLDNAGNFVWAKSMGGVNEENANSIAIDRFGNVITIGEFQVVADFDPDTSVYYQLASYGVDDIYISKLTEQGIFIWAKTIRGLGTDNGNSVTTDASGNIYSTGSFTGTDDFDPGSGIIQLTSAGSTDQYISKWDSAGNYIWAKAIGGSGSDVGKRIVVSGNGDLFTSGYFMDTADFDPGAGTNFMISNGNFDGFITGYDNSGTYLWSKKMGGSGGDLSTSLFIDRFGNLVTAGYFYSSNISFDGVTLNNYDMSGTTTDLFISKIDMTTTGINPVHQDFENLVSIYPNPANEELTIQFVNMENTDEIKLTVVNSLGQTVLETIVLNALTKIDLHLLSKGIYMLQLQTTGGKIESRKIIIN